MLLHASEVCSRARDFIPHLTTHCMPLVTFHRFFHAHRFQHACEIKQKKLSWCSRDARKPIAVPVRKLSVYLQPFRRDFYGSTLMPSCAGFLEPRKSGLENFVCSFSMSISICFRAIRSWNVSRSPKSPKTLLKPTILAFNSLMYKYISGDKLTLAIRSSNEFFEESVLRSDQTATWRHAELAMISPKSDHGIGASVTVQCRRWRCAT